jgi:predicted amidophosphoribosyltransferase
LDDVIHSLKYSDRAKLGLELGLHLGQLISPETFGPVDFLTSVPLHRVKYRDRGYNQAEWIGKGVAEIWQIPFTKQILKRNRFTNNIR